MKKFVPISVLLVLVFAAAALAFTIDGDCGHVCDATTFSIPDPFVVTASALVTRDTAPSGAAFVGLQLTGNCGGSDALYVQRAELWQAEDGGRADAAITFGAVYMGQAYAQFSIYRGVSISGGPTELIFTPLSSAAYEWLGYCNIQWQSAAEVQ